MFSLDYASNSIRTYTPIIQVYDASVEGDIATLGNGKTGVSQAKETEMKVQSDYLLTYTQLLGRPQRDGHSRLHHLLQQARESERRPYPRGRPGNPEQSRQMVRKHRRRRLPPPTAVHNGSATTVSMLARILYNYKGKIPVQRFLPPRRFFRFLLYRQPVAEFLLRRCLGWLMSEEEFMKDITWLDMLKAERFLGHTGQPESGQALIRQNRLLSECLLCRIRYPVCHLSGLPTCLPAQPQLALGEGRSMGSRCRSQLLP